MPAVPGHLDVAVTAVSEPGAPTPPEVLFVCVHNAGRSQMAAALLEHHAGGRLRARSAGSRPADRVNPVVVEAMAEVGLDISGELPKPLTDEVVNAAGTVVTMGCGDACPVVPGRRRLDWELADPAGRPLDEVRAVRDEIDRRVRALVAELTGDPATHRSAAAELARRDPVIAELVDEFGPPELRPPHRSHFAALVRAIAFQQLAGAAAAAIHGRLVALLDDEVSPERVLGLPPGAMREVGLSAAKVASITDLAARTVDGTVVLDPAGLAAETDEEVVARLSGVRGIGRWTAEMFLLFQLRRLDVWPTTDLGVRAGYGLAHGVAMPSAKELALLGEPYRPYRSVAAWYCWRAVERSRRRGPTAVTG